MSIKRCNRNYTIAPHVFSSQVYVVIAQAQDNQKDIDKKLKEIGTTCAVPYQEVPEQ